MAFNNIHSNDPSGLSLTALKTLMTQNQDTLLNKESANTFIGMESSSLSRGVSNEIVAGLESRFNQTKELLKNAMTEQFSQAGLELHLADGVSRIDDAGLESATRALMVLGNPDGYKNQLKQANKTRFTGRSGGVMNVPTWGAHGSIPMLDGGYALERFNQASFAKYKEESVQLSYKTARASNFTELFYPSVQVGVDITGVTLSLRRDVIQGNIENPMDGTPASWERVNALQALIDASLLHNTANKLYHAPKTADEEKYFVDKAKWVPEEVEPGVKRAPLALTDTEFNLLALCQVPGKMTADGYTSDDMIDPGVRMDALALSIAGTSYVEVPVKHLNSSLFIHTPGNGSDTRANLNFRVDNVVLPLDAVNRSDKTEIAELKAISDQMGTTEGAVLLKMYITADLNHTTSNMQAKPAVITVAGLRSGDKKGVNLLEGDTAATYQPLVDALACKLEGIFIDGTLSNKNLRLQGDYAETQTSEYTFPMNVGAPVSCRRPTDQDDVSAEVSALVNLRNIRTDANAITSLLNQAARLTDMVDRGYGLQDEDLAWDIGAPGAFYVQPWAKHDTVKIEDLVKYLTSDGRTEAISAAIVDLCADRASRMATETTYLPALRSRTGNPQEKMKFGIGTTAILGRYIFTSGDDRTFGGAINDIDNNINVQTTIDSRMKDTIVMVPVRSQNGSYDEFGFGNRLVSPSIITENTITQGGETYKLLQTLPIETFANNMPLVYVLKIDGLEDYIAENAPYLVEDVNGGSTGGGSTDGVKTVNNKAPDASGNVTVTTGVEEAPNDGGTYVRQSEGWVAES